MVLLRAGDQGGGIALIKTLAVLVVIRVFYGTGVA